MGMIQTNKQANKQTQTGKVHKLRINKAKTLEMWQV